MNNIRWLQMSDIHFNLTSENCDDARNKLPKFLEENYKNALDFIVICGDSTYRNSGYANVKDYLDKFKILLKQEASDNVFMVMGNHDIKRNIPKRTNSINGFYSSQNLSNTIDNTLYGTGKRDDAIYQDLIDANTEDFYRFYKEIVGYDYDDKNICKIIKLSPRNIPVNIIMINTCLFSYEKDNEEDRKGKLLIDTRGIKEILKNHDLGYSYNIMIGHHAIDCFETEYRNNFINMLSDYNIDLYLCGHTHNPSNKKIYIQDNSLPSICTGSLTSDGSDINVAMGSFNLKTGEGMIVHHKWLKKLNVWTKANDIEGTNGENQWPYISKKFMEKPFVEKIKEPLQNEIDFRFGENNFKIFELVQEITSFIGGSGDNCCGMKEFCKCSEKEQIFCSIFSTALNSNNQRNLFTKEDLLLTSVGIRTYGFYRYIYTKNDSSIKTEFGRTVNKFLNNSKLTDVLMDILRSCFDEEKFVKLPFEREIENESEQEILKIQTKKISVILRFIDKIVLRDCLLNTIVVNNTKKEIKIDQRNIVYSCELCEESAFIKNDTNLSEYSTIIREIQKINDERMLFNSYFGHIALIDSIKIKIDFFNESAFGYRKVIDKIEETITSINYNVLENGTNDDLFNSIFYRLYPKFNEDFVLQNIKKKKEEN